MYAEKLAPGIAAAKGELKGVARTNAGEEFIRVAWAKESPEVRQEVLKTVLEENAKEEALLLNQFQRTGEKEMAWVK
jgi:hypothetical protein